MKYEKDWKRLQVARRHASKLANQYEIDKAREMFEMVGCQDLFDRFGHHITLPRYQPNKWCMDSQWSQLDYFSDNSWEFRFYYAVGYFGCNITLNGRGKPTRVSFVDSEQYCSVYNQMERHIKFLEKCGYPIPKF